jgi:hypothetical protein
MTLAGFEPETLASQQQTHTLDREANGIDRLYIFLQIMYKR